MINWSAIQTVLFDMDGTLLDLHYDNYFWNEYLPDQYANIHALSADDARRQLTNLFLSRYGELEFYCVDYWSEQLGIDVMPYKLQVSSRVKYLPHAKNLLSALRSAGLEMAIVTNAHHKTYQLKNNIVNLSEFFEHIHISHHYGLPKEDLRFWHALKLKFPFNPETTLLVDDNIDVLLAAKKFGIRHLALPLKPDSQRPAKTQQDLPTDACDFYLIESLQQLIP